jgi:recombination protein RecA
MKLALEDEVIEKSGAFFSYKDQRLGQGKDKAVQFLRDTPAVRDQIVQEILTRRKPRILDDARLEAEAAKEEAEAAEELAKLEAEPAPAEKKKRGKAAAE